MSRKRTDADRQTDRLRSKYGIDLKQKDGLLQAQGGGCAICGAQEANFVIDHCHAYEAETGGIKIRGVLCANCNSMLGFAKDRTETLLAAVSYLQKSKG